MNKVYQQPQPNAQRKFGIELVGNIPWGTHVCQFYESKQDLVDILVPYFAEGLRSNEFCMWITSPPLEVADAKEALKKAVPHLEKYLQKGQIEIISYNDWYLLGGKFDCNRVLEGWVQKETAALKNGFNGLRLTGNTFWIERSLWNSFVDYEAAVNSVIGKHRMIALCTYCLLNCTGTDVIDVVRNHIGTLIKQTGKWVFVEDAVQRKEHQKKLAESEHRWATTLSSIGDGVIATDTKGKISFMNAVAEALTGWTLNEAAQKPIEQVFQIINEKTGRELENPVSKVLKKGAVCCLANHTILIRKDGIKVAIDDSGAPIKSQEGKTLGVVLVFRDITQRKQAEEALIASEKRYHSLFANLMDGFAFCQMIYDDNAKPIDFSYIEVNDSFERLTGLKKEKVIGKKVSQAIPGTIEANPEIFEIYGKVAQTGTPERFELFFQPLSMWLDISVYSPKKGYFVAVFENITERKKAQEALMQAQEKLQEYAKNLEGLVEERTKQLTASERMAAIGQTAGMVGHDIRNPLQAITGEVYLLKEELKNMPEDTAKQAMQESTEAIEENITYINKIISDLQDYTRPLKPNIEEVNLKELISSTLTMTNIPRTIQTQIIVPEKIVIKSDAAYLRRILTNLTVNAVQAIPNEGKLTIQVVEKNKKIKVSVKDTGLGIPDTVKPNLFKPLFTTKSKGQGLGLAVVKRLVEGLNGKITFSSKPGTGTEFAIELPMAYGKS